MYYRSIEHAAFALDSLRMPLNPESINEIGIRSKYRVVGIDKHIRLDRFDRVEKILYSEPKPEQGETHCGRVTCPNWIEEAKCWKCD